DVVLWLLVTEFVGPLDHHLDCAESRFVQREDPLAAFVLALAYVECVCVKVDVPATEVLDLDASHGRISGEDGGTVNMRPFGISLRNLEQSLLLRVGKDAA